MVVGLGVAFSGVARIIEAAAKSGKAMRALYVVAGIVGLPVVAGSAVTLAHAMQVGDDSVVIGAVSPSLHVGNRSVIIGATDGNGNTILTTPMAVGAGAHAGPGSIAIGAGAGAGGAAR